MSDMQGTIMPAILFHGLESFETCRSAASTLLSAGYPVVASCVQEGDAAQAARQSGCAAVEAERGGTLRAGLEYFLENMKDAPGVVAVSAGEGYSVEDIFSVAARLAGDPGKLVMAWRKDNPKLGLLPRLERLLAWLAFACVHGRSVRDPWAGLAAIPAALVPVFLGIGGEGGRYGFNIVLNLQHKGVKAVNVPVGAEYSFSEGSGFRSRLVDILRILILPFKFISASLAATLADYAVYVLMDTVLVPGHWAVSLTTSRSAGAVLGYFLNRSLVFRQKNDSWRKEAAAAAMFALLALFNYGASLLLVYVLHDLLGVNEIIARPISDALLFVTSYTVQREFIFRKRPPAV